LLKVYAKLVTLLIFQFSNPNGVLNKEQSLNKKDKSDISLIFQLPRSLRTDKLFIPENILATEDTFCILKLETSKLSTAFNPENIPAKETLYCKFQLETSTFCTLRQLSKIHGKAVPGPRVQLQALILLTIELLPPTAAGCPNILTTFVTLLVNFQLQKLKLSKPILQKA
jgi:hypothetical protein